MLDYNKSDRTARWRARCDAEEDAHDRRRHARRPDGGGLEPIADVIGRVLARAGIDPAVLSEKTDA